MKDMTSGNSMKLIIGFWIPMFLGNLFQQFYNMVDSIIVGKYVGVNALAGVGATGSIYFLIIGAVMGITSGYGVRMGMSFGSGDMEELRKDVINSIYQSVLVTVILTPLTMIFCRTILIVMDTPEEVFADAYNYLIVILAGIGCTMLYNLAAAILRAIGDSRTPLITLVGAALLNIVLDLLFVIVFHMGTFGAGFATVISQGLSGIVCMIYIFRHNRKLRIRKGEFGFSPGRNGQLLCIGLPMALQFSITAVGTIILQVAVNGLGAAAVAAMAAGNKIENMLMAAPESMGQTMATYGSQNIGAGKHQRILQGLRCSIGLQAVICVICVLIITFFGRPIAALFIDPGEEAIIEQILLYLRINIYLFFLLGFLLSIRNTIQGIGYSFAAMFAGVSELIARALVATYGARFGFTGLCFASPVAWLFADLVLIAFWVYLRRKVLVITIPSYMRRHQSQSGRP